MSINERYFLVGKEWNVLYLPSKPNGFAILVIGDVNHYVNSNTSSWLQKPDQYSFIQQLKAEGYTIISSNLFGRNWGSDESCEFLQRVIDEVMKQEILNRRIHIIAEGMGALVAAKLIPKKESLFRSVVMIDPCLSLKKYFEKEKNNKLFYKRILRELKQAYHLDKTELEKAISKMDCEYFEVMPVPIKIFHRIKKTAYSLEDHIRPYEHMCLKSDCPVEVSIFLKSTDLDQFALPTIKFFQQFEKDL